MQKLNRRPTRFRGQTVGLDVHKRVIRYALLNRRGDEIVNEEMAADASNLTRVVRAAQEKGRVQVALEASGCFQWAFDLLVKLVGRKQVHVAAPSRVRVIAESSEKTDANDAWWLAYLLYERRLPESFVAEGALRELRIACREQRAVTDERADLMRRLRSHLAQLGRSIPSSAWRSMVGRDGINQVLKQLTDEGIRSAALERLWRRFDQLTEEQAYWDCRVVELSRPFSEISVLDELPGIGPLIAAIVWSELGDPRRYDRAKAYAKATGLTPGNRISAGKRRKKGMSRDGSARVRWALTRAVVACLRSRRGSALAVRLWVEARTGRQSRRQAIVAAARKLAEAIWRRFNLGEDFDICRAFGGATVTS